MRAGDPRLSGAFEGVRCLVGPQPVTARTILTRRLAAAGVPKDRVDDLDQRLVLRTGIGLARRVPQEWARRVCVPTFLYQVRADLLTEPRDVQAMFDNIPLADKTLQWIDGTTARWDGYLEFQRRPAADAGVVRQPHGRPIQWLASTSASNGGKYGTIGN